MTAADLAGAICDRLVDMHGETEHWDDGTSIVDARSLVSGHVVVAASDGRIYRIVVEEWP